MPDDITNIRVTLLRIHVIDDEDWFGSGELYFDGELDGVPIPRSQTFDAASGTDIPLTGPSWQRVIDVRGKASIQLVLRGKDEDVFWDDSLGTATATIQKNAAGDWPDATFSVTSTDPADFTLYYKVEPILALDPARPETAVVCRQNMGSPTCSTISAVPVRVVKIKATVPSTPPLTPRAAPPTVANAWAAPVDLVFESTKPIPSGPVVFHAADFAQPDALVLISHCQGPIQLEAETSPPNVDVFFEARRATDDSGTLGAGIPVITNTGNTTATMDTNERGSFYVIAYIDANRNRQRDDNEPGIILPVIFVEARIQTPATEHRSVPNPGNLSVTFDGVAGNVDTGNYTYVYVNSGDFNSLATAGVALDADILLVGGGADGMRGLDRVFTGWMNNFTALRYEGTYADGSIVRRLQIDNIGAANGPAISGTPSFISAPPNPVPNPIAFPPSLLDTGRGNPELGGRNTTFGHSAEAAGIPQQPLGGLGEKRTVTAVDSPGWLEGYQRRHPDASRATRLRSIFHDLHSSTRLVAWTNTTGGNAPSPGVANSVGFRTYTVVAEVNWTVSATYNITGSSPHIRLSQTGAAPTITAARVEYTPAVPPSTANLEVRPPVTLRTRVVDAR
jgi:hypothetical protein